MSNWIGTSKGNPESITGFRCCWEGCTTYVPNRFHGAGLDLCRDHALLAWSVVDNQIGDGLSTERTPKKRPDFELTEAEERYGIKPCGYEEWWRRRKRVAPEVATRRIA